MLRSIAFMVGGVLLGWSLASSPERVSEDLSVARPLRTPRQTTLLAALDQPSELDFGTQPLQDVVSFLTEKHGIAMELDTRALHEAGIRGSTPVTCALEGITLRSLLRLLLREHDLTYVIGDGYLLITTKTEAENKLCFQAYPVDDLVTVDSEFRSPLDAGGKSGADFQNLIDVITSVVAPGTWDRVGGPGSLSAFGNARALGVSQTDEVHEELAALLVSLRRVRDKQIAAAKPANRFVRRQARDTQGQEDLEVRVYRFFQPPDPAVAGSPAKGAAKKPAPDGSPPDVRNAADEAIAAAKLDAWTKVIVKLAPEMIAPESWQPAGPGQIRAMSGTVVVRQTADVQYRVAKLIYGMMMTDVDSSWYPLTPTYRCAPPVRLAPPPIEANWPQDAEPPPHGAEARIIAALEETCDFDFAAETLGDALAALAQSHNIPIQPDHRALQTAGVAYDTPITRSIRGIPLKSALRLMLDELKLSYVICNEALLITTKDAAENRMVSKVYPVFDLVVRRPGAPPQAPALDFGSLIDNITGSLAPTTWDEVGGPGAITAFTNAGALVISQTPETHQQIAAFLQAIREVAAQPK